MIVCTFSSSFNDIPPSFNLFSKDLGYDTRYKAVETGLADLITKRKAEEKRIEEGRSGCGSDCYSGLIY